MKSRHKNSYHRHSLIRLDEAVAAERDKRKRRNGVGIISHDEALGYEEALQEAEVGK